jgi:hypothetical protein
MPEIPPPQPNTQERSSPLKPDLPLDVLVAIAETERKVKHLLEDCRTVDLLVLKRDVAKATELMRVSISEAFRPRADYYVLQSGFCRAWLDEAADETVAAMLDVVPLQLVSSSRYRESVPAIRKELRNILQAHVEERIPERAGVVRHGPPLDAVATDEERREKAKRDLVRALQGYVGQLDNPVACLIGDATRVIDIFCVYASENYASRAAKFFTGMPPLDPRDLFEAGDLTERRDLCGLPTIGDVFALAEGGVRVKGLNFENGSLRWLLREEPWGNQFRQQIRNCITECVRTTRAEYELRFPNSVEAGDSAGLAPIPSPGAAKGAMPDAPAWKELQTVFLQYRVEHADLCAVWTWVYTYADQSARLPPHGQWIFRGGLPGSQHLFKEIARRAASRLPNPSGIELWRLWLDLMRTEGYTRRIVPRTVSWHEFQEAAEASENPPLPPGFEDEEIDNIFKSSADFCLVRSLAEASPRSVQPVQPGCRPEEKEPAVDGSIGVPHLSDRDRDIHDRLGEQSFRNLTNSEISRDRNLKKALLEFRLKSGADDTKACLDRIRRGKGYPLSREISEKRSSRN